jgi:hypothetical protein
LPGAQINFLFSLKKKNSRFTWSNVEAQRKHANLVAHSQARDQSSPKHAKAATTAHRHREYTTESSTPPPPATAASN